MAHRAAEVMRGTIAEAKFVISPPRIVIASPADERSFLPSGREIRLKLAWHAGCLSTGPSAVCLWHDATVLGSQIVGSRGCAILRGLCPFVRESAARGSR